MCARARVRNAREIQYVFESTSVQCSNFHYVIRNTCFKGRGKRAYPLAIIVHQRWATKFPTRIIVALIVPSEPIEKSINRNYEKQ